MPFLPTSSLAVISNLKQCTHYKMKIKEKICSPSVKSVCKLFLKKVMLLLQLESKG